VTPRERSGGRWSSRSIGSRFQHGIFYFLIRFGGRRAAYLLLSFVALYYATFRPVVRSRSLPYLSRRFPDHRGFARWRDVLRLTHSFGQVLVDRAVVGLLGPESTRASLNGKEELLALLAEDRGLVVLTAHVGSWQVAMSALSFLDRPVHMLMRREEGDVDRHFDEHGRAERPYRIIDPGGFLGGAVEMVAALKRGEVVCVMGDRLFGNEANAVAVPFLGEPAAFPVAAFRLAASTGAPVAVLLSRKTAPEAYEIDLAAVIRPRGVRGGTAPLVPFVRQYVDAIERFARQYPFQVFNFIDMWSGAPDPAGGAEGAPADGFQSDQGKD
jgi:predicted LPLAT superfamily acyltransferase